MLASAPVIETVAKALRDHRPPHYVLDPVMISKTGFPLLRPGGGRGAQRARSSRWPRSSRRTCTRRARSRGGRCGRLAQAEAAGRLLVEAGARAVLVKGGHLEERPATDVLVTREGVRRLPGRARRRASHSRHRLHLLGGDRHPARARARPRGRDRPREGLRHRGDPRGAADRAGESARRTTSSTCGARASARRWVARLAGAEAPPVKPPLGRLHVITDATLQDRFSHVELARLAAAGGADAVQFREKRPWTTRSPRRDRDAMRRALDGRRVCLVVDDRVDVALAAGRPCGAPRPGRPRRGDGASRAGAGRPDRRHGEQSRGGAPGRGHRRRLPRRRPGLRHAVQGEPGAAARARRLPGHRRGRWRSP